MSRVSRSQIARGIADMLDSGASHKKLVNTIAAYLVSERRTSELDALMREVQSVRAKRGTLEATATTAFALSPSVKKDIQAVLRRDFGAGKDVVLNEQVEPSVLGGLHLESAGKQLDLTVRTKLNRLKQTAVQGGTN